MSKKYLELRHELYDILTNPHSLYLASNAHLFEFEVMALDAYNDDCTVISIAEQASKAYLAMEDDGA